ncbi:hypothetical protein [Amycolatopsis sp. lyj-112]|uniref:hypothetical protein n=1 Tax=Amycolatopsis sp. lyj-112 TaxID=2789288 RepID=UPI00397D293F
MQQHVEGFIASDLHDMAQSIEKVTKKLREDEEKPVRVSTMTLTSILVARGDEDAGLTYSALVCFDIG